MNIVTNLSRYLFIILVLLFTLRDYTYFRRKTPEKRRKVEDRQLFDVYAFMIFGFTIIFINSRDFKVLLLLAGLCLYYALTVFLFRVLYKKSSMLLINNMLMLMTIGFVMIARLNTEQALWQFLIAVAGTVIALIIPVIVRKLKLLSKLKWLYAFIGAGCLLVVLALAVTSGGAKLSISIGGFTFQLSELVKITFVFFMAASLAKNTSVKNIVITSIVAFIHIGILVLSTDLGTAAVFYVTYLVMVFVGAKKPSYTLLGTAAGAGAAVAAYFLFGHVRARVAAWRDPFSVYDGSGYQIAQGLFAISAGGWFGTGLCNGSPNKIPVAAKDYIFAAICEEFGIVFAICLILVCMSMFLLIVNISMQIRRRFYKLIALGLGCEYAFQVFLTIGGVTKFIPLTGITLPLVSYGGSSVLSTIIMISIIEGLYILREDEEEEIERQKEEIIAEIRGQA